MTTQRFTVPVAVFLLLVQDDKTLLLRRANTGWHDGDYDLIAGHIEGNESLTAALLREAREEIGITLAPEDIAFAHLTHAYFAEDDKEYLQIFFEVKKWEGQPSIMEPDKCDDLQWFPLSALPDNLAPASKAGLEAYAARNIYSESGFTS